MSQEYSITDLFFELEYYGGPIGKILSLLSLDDLITVSQTCRILFEATRVYLSKTKREYSSEELLMFLLNDRLMLEPLFFALLQNECNQKYFKKLFSTQEETYQMEHDLEINEYERIDGTSTGDVLIDIESTVDLDRFHEIIFSLAYCLHNDFVFSFKFVYDNFFSEHLRRAFVLNGNLINFVASYHNSSSLEILRWLLESKKVGFTPYVKESASFFEGEIFHKFLAGDDTKEKMFLYAIKSCVKHRDVETLKFLLKFEKFRKTEVKSSWLTHDFKIFRIFMNYNDINIDYQSLVSRLFNTHTTTTTSSTYENNERISSPLLTMEEEDDTDLYEDPSRFSTLHVRMLRFLKKKSSKIPELNNIFLSILSGISISLLDEKELSDHKPGVLDLLLEDRAVFDEDAALHYLIPRSMNQNSFLFAMLREQWPEYIRNSSQNEEKIDRDFLAEAVKNPKLKILVDIDEEPISPLNEFDVKGEQEEGIPSEYILSKNVFGNFRPFRPKKLSIGIIKNTQYGEEAASIFIDAMLQYADRCSRRTYDFKYVAQHELTQYIDGFDIILHYFNAHNFLGLEYTLEMAPVVQCLKTMDSQHNLSGYIPILVSEIRQGSGKFFPPVVSKRKGVSMAKKLGCKAYCEVMRFEKGNLSFNQGTLEGLYDLMAELVKRYF